MIASVCVWSRTRPDDGFYRHLTLVQLFDQGIQKRMTKHIFVTGGVVSSLGKGLTSASVGMILEQRGLTVRMQKLDPHILSLIHI